MVRLERDWGPGIRIDSGGQAWGECHLRHGVGFPIIREL